jgi:hypothetical protein
MGTGLWRFLSNSAMVAMGILMMSLATERPVAAIEVPQLVSKTRLVQSPTSGLSVWVDTWYSRGVGSELLSYIQTENGTDTALSWQQRYSADNGQSWSAWGPLVAMPAARNPDPEPGWIDPATGRMLQMVRDWQGYSATSLWYRVSTDGGRTNAVAQQVIQAGSQYNSSHPVDDVWIGQNSLLIDAYSSQPIGIRGGKILVPVNINPLGSNGKLYVPPGCNDWYNSAVLIGTWNSDMTLNWTLSQPVVGNPTKVTRGMDEPTLAAMPDGRILMVCRGSNDTRPSLPGFKWYSVSNDDGMTWSTPSPWTYADGSSFYSPSSCSQLLETSHGKYYWIGNIVSGNPSGNDPRYPLVMGEVDPTTMLLEKDTVTAIDSLGAGDDGSLQLSNFAAYEDRVTGDIVLTMTRLLSSGGDAYVYRIAVSVPEPSSVVLLLSAVVGLSVYAWRMGAGRMTIAR